MFSKNHVYSSLRICDTCFISMIIVGDHKKEVHIPILFDDNDYVTAFISIGVNYIEGGETVYFNGFHIDSIGEKVFSVLYKHGRIQIGFFDQVLHGASNWCYGSRGVINMSITKKMLAQFYQEGDFYYKQYVNAGYPSGEFLSI